MNESAFLASLRDRLKGSASSENASITPEEADSLLNITTKYSILYEVGKLVSSEIDQEALLRLAMDKVLELTRAQRGFIALVDNQKQLKFKVARNINKADIEKPRFEVSRSIIEKVLTEGEPVSLPDAMADEGFSASESVTRLQLLSVLCTPIKIAGKIEGVIYVDNSNIKRLFDDTLGGLMVAFSEQIGIALENATRFQDLKKSNQELLSELRSQYRFESIIGSGPRMVEVLELVANVADTDATVLIQGENGTGKELIARALHQNSSRKDRPFTTVHCGAIPKDLIESELFGHVKGAFTGAINDKKGKFELAHTGTIFLDEIGEMIPSLQIRLLQVLQSGTFSPVGSETDKHCDVRIIAATNRDLKKMIEETAFREDLYYRLNVIDVFLPPLRERPEDILPLIDHFIRKHKSGQTLKMTRSVQQILQSYHFPGNIRQLENIIQRAVILCKGDTINKEYLPQDIFETENHGDESQRFATFKEKKDAVIKKFEQDELRRILSFTGGQVRESARVAGMDVKNFSEKLKRYNIKPKDYK